MASLQLPTIHVAGAPLDMGRAHGEDQRERVRAFVAQRFDAARGYFAERGAGTVDALIRVGGECLGHAKAWHPAGAEEHMGIAQGAGVDAVELYAAANMTDVRDVVLYAETGRTAVVDASSEGCSAAIVPAERARGGELVAGQTWDLNPTDLDFVIAVRREPRVGPATWSVTCAGCLSLVGMNQHGVVLGTTNVKTRRSRPGVGYLSLLHRALGERTARAATEMVVEAPRAAAHTYWFADAEGGGELECDAERAVVRHARDEPVVRTNHCLATELEADTAEEPPFSSYRRYERLQSLLGEGEVDVARFREAFADRQDGVDSINRYPEDEQGTATNACIVAVPARRELWACRGPADRGAWVQLEL